MSAQLRRVLEVETIRTAAWAQANAHEWPEFRRFKKHSLSACWRQLYVANAKIAPAQYVPVHELSPDVDFDNADEVADHLHLFFFASLEKSLRSEDNSNVGNVRIFSERRWLRRALVQLTEVAQACADQLTAGAQPAFSLIYQQVQLNRPELRDDSGWLDFRALRKALVLITADLFFLFRPRTNLAYVPASEWKSSSDTAFFALDHWREIFLTQDYQILNDDLVSLHIEELEAHSLQKIEPLNEKGKELTDLCSWAAAYGLEGLAQRLLEAAYKCGIGYGWRKDWNLPRLLDAVEEVAQRDKEAAIRAIKQLAPIYTSLDKMTESTGANQSDLAGLLIQLMPEVYPRYYRFWLERGEWYEAEKTFGTFATHAAARTPEAHVAMTYKRRTETQQTPGGPGLEQDAQQRPSTTTKDISEYEHNRTLSVGTEEPVDSLEVLNVENFLPNQFVSFLATAHGVRKYENERSLIIHWFQHWETKGRGADLLAALDIALKENRLTSSGTQLLDLAFSLSLRLHGPSKAFRWLVEAHRHRYGWSDQYYDQEDASARLALVARHYRKRWREFVTSSTEPVYRSAVPGRVIPNAALINLLLQVDEVDRALSVLQTMVEVTLEEFEMQPLTEPLWLRGVRP